MDYICLTMLTKVISRVWKTWNAILVKLNFNFNFVKISGVGYNNIVFGIQFYANYFSYRKKGTKKYAQRKIEIGDELIPVSIWGLTF